MNSKVEIDPSRHGWVSMIQSLTHGISNFTPGARMSKVKNTFILSPWASSMFGLEIEHGQAYLGVQREFFPGMLITSWFTAAILDNQPGLFLVFAGGGSKIKPQALRIFFRQERIRLLYNIKSLKIVSINGDGNRLLPSNVTEFTLPIKRIARPDWER